MTGREKIEAAFSAAGSRQTPVMIPYPSIVARDHQDEFDPLPWWYRFAPQIELQAQFWSRVIELLGHDWFEIFPCATRQERQATRLEVRSGEIFLANMRNGKTFRLDKPRVSGWSDAGIHSVHRSALPERLEDVDSAVPLTPDCAPQEAFESGACDLAAALVDRFGRTHMPFAHIASPVWSCYSLWGCEGLMMLVADRPELVTRAAERYLHNAIMYARQLAAAGAKAVWIEECMTDLMSPQDYEALNVPVLVRLVEAVHGAGMKAILYYCGNPWDRWDILLDVGADGLALEESKKNWRIDIEEVVSKTRGRCVVFGNLDAIGILPKAPEDELRREISRQIASGLRNNGRFVMSLGSPPTPETPLSRLREYCRLVRAVETDPSAGKL